MITARWPSRSRSALLVLAGPRLLALGAALALAAPAARRGALRARCCAWPGAAWSCSPARATASPAIARQLLAWALQWLACYAVLLALGLQSQATLATAAAILLAVNVSAILPATPSNVGVFQAACLVVLAAYGVGAGPGPRLRHHPAGGRGR